MKAASDGAPASISCLYLAVTAQGWFENLIRVAPGLNLSAAIGKELGMSDLPNPFALPCRTSADVALVTSDWFKRAYMEHGSEVGSIMERLRRAARTLIAIDGSDGISLTLPPHALRQFDIVIKAQGLFRDPELYNYKIGPFHPGVNWSEKSVRRRQQYSEQELSKLRLSLPCFVYADPRIRHEVRRVATRKHPAAQWLVGSLERAAVESSRFIIRRSKQVQFLGSLTHIQRISVLQTLRRLSIGGEQGITTVPDLVFGTRYCTAKGRELSGPEESDFRIDIPKATGCESYDSPTLVTREGEKVISDPTLLAALKMEVRSQGFQKESMQRLRVIPSLRAHRAVLAPTGYGELTFRHGEALLAGAALITQDLRHIETMFPFIQDQNVIYCRHDLSDLAAKLRLVTQSPEEARAVGRNGHLAWRDWTSDLVRLLDRGITEHIRCALAQS